MSDSLLKKLHSLDATLQTVLSRFEDAQNELHSFKEQPHVDMSQFAELKHQLTEAANLQKRTADERDSLQDKLSQLGAEYETLAENHHGLTHDHNALLEKCANLEEANRVLQEKNHTASEHARVILERLTRIDQAGH